ncbi:hypothetical protein D9611_010813 [Ephemerocybe angulata]|uniref:Protein kinase domain-containing protein n=1 Tax=Ephemerocybe angulata TaxID=980116 RepID=A0A8H5BBY2_9AGAR|nr:hypothetical protein D9611_010813 [Tulosesus angulatus]
MRQCQPRGIHNDTQDQRQYFQRVEDVVSSYIHSHIVSLAILALPRSHPSSLNMAEKKKKVYAEDHFAKLLNREIYWRDNYEWLLESGYRLRPRFSPGWIPSWKANPKLPFRSCEDSVRQFGGLCDASRTTDGSHVMLKTVDLTRFVNEVAIMEFVNQEPQRSDPLNHCMPLLDVLVPPNEPSRRIIAMPICRMWDSPDFDTVGEVVDCIKQLIESVQFLHANRIAHRDIAYGNFMMDTMLFTTPFHPFFVSYRLDYKGSVKAKYTRTQRRPKYYIIDFGLSVRYEPHEMPPMRVMGAYGSDRTVPEYTSRYEPHNPFPIDIYCLGNMIRREILTANPEQMGFAWIIPLIEDMMNPDPTRRPTIDEVATRYDEDVSLLTYPLLRSRWIQTWIEALPHFLRKIRYIQRQTPPIPS